MSPERSDERVEACYAFDDGVVTGSIRRIIGTFASALMAVFLRVDRSHPAGVLYNSRKLADRFEIATGTHPMYRQTTTMWRQPCREAESATRPSQPDILGIAAA